MKLKPIINSLLETDLYKFNMGNIIFKRYNNYKTTWTFKCRNKGVKFTKEMVQEIREQIDHYCKLRFKTEEIDYLRRTNPWLSDGYLNFLHFWHPVRSEIFVQTGDDDFGEAVKLVPYNDCGLAIEARGTWLSTSMYEIAILAIVNEVYFAMKYDGKELEKAFKERTRAKIDMLNIGRYNIGVFSEFGMRRRLSAKTQDWLIGQLKKVPGFVGTSNVYLAMKHDVKPVGTMAHEFVQCVGQGNHELNPAYSNKFVMEAWTGEYQTRNGIMLGDTIGTDVFLRDFDLAFATLYSGVRHDSGNPFVWGEKILALYEALGIDPKTKTLLFSDSLDFARATAIRKHFQGRCKVAFGIGTYLANDTFVDALNIIMKVTLCNGSAVAKVSDTPGKGMCRDEEYVDYLNRTIKWRLDHETWEVKAKYEEIFAKNVAKLIQEQLAA